MIRRPPSSTLFPYATLSGSGGVERGGRLCRVGELGRAALLGQQVDGERRVAARRDPAGDRADVVGETAGLVDDQDRRSGEHTSDSSHLVISDALLCLKNKKT